MDIVDAHDQPYAVMPLEQAHQQMLYHRAVLVLVYDVQGRLYLQKRNEDKLLYPGCWDISATGHVKAGESREDAALRELYEELGLRPARLEKLQSIPASPFTGYEFITLFSAGRVKERPKPNPDEVSDGMFVESEELEFLAGQYNDMLTPGLVTFWSQGLLFSGAG